MDSPVEENHRFNAKALYKGWLRKCFRGRQLLISAPSVFADIPFLQNWLGFKGMGFSMSQVVSHYLNVHEGGVNVSWIAQPGVGSASGVSNSGVGSSPSPISFLPGVQGQVQSVGSVASQGGLMPLSGSASRQLAVDLVNPPPGFAFAPSSAKVEFIPVKKESSQGSARSKDNWIEKWGRSMASHFTSLLRSGQGLADFPKTFDVNSQDQVVDFSNIDVNASKRSRDRSDDEVISQKGKRVNLGLDSSESLKKYREASLDVSSSHLVVDSPARVKIDRLENEVDDKKDSFWRLGSSREYRAEGSSGSFPFPRSKSMGSPKGGFVRGQERVQVHNPGMKSKKLNFPVLDDAISVEEEMIESDKEIGSQEKVPQSSSEFGKLSSLFQDFMTAQASVNRGINEKLDLLTSSLCDFKKEVSDKFNGQDRRLLLMENAPEDEIVLSEVGSDSTEFMSDEDVSDYVLPVDEVREFLLFSKLPLFNKFEIPQSWEFFRDSQFLLSIKVPDLGIISSSLFYDLGFEEGKRMISFTFPSFSTPDPIPSSNIAMLMRKEFDSFLKISNKDFELSKMKPPAEGLAGSSLSWTGISLLNDSLDVKEQVTKLFDISRWNDSLLPGIPDFGKSGWSVNFIWKEIPEYQKFSQLFFEGELPANQLGKFGFLPKAKSEILEEKRNRHILANAFSAAIQLEVGRSALSSVSERASGIVASEIMLVHSGTDCLKRYLWSAVGPCLLNWFRSKLAIRSVLLSKCPNSMIKKDILHGSPYNHGVFSDKSMEDIADLARIKGTDPVTFLNNPKFPSLSQSKTRWSFARGRGQATFKGQFSRGQRPFSYGRGIRSRGGNRPKSRFSQKARGYRGNSSHNTKGDSKRSKHQRDQYE